MSRFESSVDSEGIETGMTAGEKDEVLELLKAYTIVDKINTVVWCVERNRVGSTFFEKTIYDLVRILMKKERL